MSILDGPTRISVHRPPGTRPTVGDQLETQLRYRVLAGELRRGERLPPVRRLAAFLRVNRNTVAQVYRRLEAAGYLSTDGRRGTHVLRPSALNGRLATLIDRLGVEARRQGLATTDLQALITMRAGPGRTRARLGFVECNMVDLTYFRRLLEREVATPIRSILLRDLPLGARRCDLLVTTFFHLEEVRRRAGDREVVGLVALPDFQTLEAVAGLPRDARVALVCATAEGVRAKARSLRSVGLARPRLITATLDDPARLRQVVGRAEVLLAAPRVLERLRGSLPATLRVVPFASVLSEGAVALLRERLAAWQNGPRPVARGPAARPTAARGAGAGA